MNLKYCNSSLKEAFSFFWLVRVLARDKENGTFRKMAVSQVGFNEVAKENKLFWQTIKVIQTDSGLRNLGKWNSANLVKNV